MRGQTPLIKVKFDPRDTDGNVQLTLCYLDFIGGKPSDGFVFNTSTGLSQPTPEDPNAQRLIYIQTAAWFNEMIHANEMRYDNKAYQLKANAQRLIPMVA